MEARVGIGRRLTNFDIFLPRLSSEVKRNGAYRRVSARSGLVFISVAIGEDDQLPPLRGAGAGGG